MTAPHDDRPRIDVSPEDGLLDEPLDIRLRGFAPRHDVTLHARAVHADGYPAWASHATFATDDDGAVDLGRQAPTAGTYSGVDPTGLLWSLSPSHGAAGARAVADGLTPVQLEFSAAVDDEVVATARALRHAVDPSVVVWSVREAGIVANLFVPAGAGPFPTIVVVGGSGGGFADGSAALFASHGYAALSLAYFGVDGLPRELRNIPLEYFEAAIGWLRARPEVEADRLAISGTSRGGELALLLAARHPELTAVVAYVPSGYLWGAVSRSDDDSPDAFPSWTCGGAGLPYVARIRNDAVAPDADGTLTLTPAFLRALEDEERAAAAAIPAKHINGPILLISGKDDALWPSAVFGDLIVRRLAQHSFPHPYRHLSYEGAGHTLGPRYAPTTVTKAFHPVRQVSIDLGGTPSAIAAARDDSWPRVLEFLKTHLKAPADAPALAAAATG